MERGNKTDNDTKQLLRAWQHYRNDLLEREKHQMC